MDRDILAQNREKEVLKVFFVEQDEMWDFIFGDGGSVEREGVYFKYQIRVPDSSDNKCPALW